MVVGVPEEGPAPVVDGGHGGAQGQAPVQLPPSLVPANMYDSYDSSLIKEYSDDL